MMISFRPVQCMHMRRHPFKTRHNVLTHGRVFTSNMEDHDRSHNYRNDMDETCRWDDESQSLVQQRCRIIDEDGRTRLKNECASYFHVSAVAYWLDSLVAADEGARNECCRLADRVE